MTTRPAHQLPGMHGLRALACLSVFLANVHHSMRMPVSGRVGPLDLAVFAESGVGVVVLIVLSGALLSLPLWRQLDAGGPFQWTAFAMRRAARIVPAYYACLLAYVWFAGGANDPIDLLAHAFFVNNLIEGAFYSISPQFWTIGMFVQFYVLLPLLFAGLRRAGLRGRQAVFSVLICGLASYAVHVLLMITQEQWLKGPLRHLASPGGYVVSHSTLAHMPHFLLGVASGFVLWRMTLRRNVVNGWPRATELLWWATAAGLLVVSSVSAAERLAVPYGRYVLPWLPALAALLVITTPAAPFASRLLQVAPLRWLGQVSYGVYVYHMACLIAVQRLARAAQLDLARSELVLAGLGLTVAVATASYLLLEQPILRWIHSRRVEAVSASA